MQSNKKLILGFVISTILVIVFILMLFSLTQTKERTDLEPFAKCIAASGAKFYGTFWCPHCQEQKQMFGTAKKDLPYIECSTSDGKGQLQVCTDAEVSSYPTWILGEGTRLEGTLSLQALADKTKCELPK